MDNKSLEILNELIKDEKSPYSTLRKEKLLNLKEEVLNLQEININLQKAVNEQSKRHMVFRNNACWDLNEENPQPYCPICWEKEKKAIHLFKSLEFNTKYDCKNCNGYFWIDSIPMGTSKKESNKKGK